MRSVDIEQLERTRAVSLALTKHHLTGATSAEDVLGVARDLVGLHATDPFSPYLQLRARMERFVPETLDDLLYGVPRLARMGAMRGTLFLETLDVLPVVVGATRRMRSRGRERFLAASGFDEGQYLRSAEQIEIALAGRALSAREIRAAVGSPAPLSAVLNTMADEARIVRWRPVGGRRDSTPTYRLFREALPGVDLTGLDEASATTRLVELYVRRYGPATEADLAWWSGLDRASLRAARDRLGDDLVTVGIAGLGQRYLIAGDDLAALRGLPEPHGEVSFLPILDPYLMGYRDRRRFLEPRAQAYVFDRGGNATSTILVDGRVAGVWDWRERRRPEVRLHLFEPLAPDLHAKVRARAEEVGAFIAGKLVPVVEVSTMRPLTEGAAWIRSPLADPN